MQPDTPPTAADHAAPPGLDRRSIPPSARESRWLAADGWPLRRIDWPGAGDAPRGSILFLPGRGDAYEKYLETLDCWHSAGWRVTAADWRGQAGSGRLGTDAVTGHIDDFGRWIDDLAGLWRDWSAQTPGPHVLAGHSMGGHLTLRAVVEQRVDPAALILSAPMLGFAGLSLPARLMLPLARAIAALGDPRRPAWKWSERPGQVAAGRAALLTHDAARYEDELWWRAARPELAMGPGSWGWIAAAYASMVRLFAPGGLEGVRVPVLILAADKDRLVSLGAIRAAAARLPDCELLRFGAEARHEILREADPVRCRALAAIDRMLAGVAAR